MIGEGLFFLGGYMIHYEALYIIGGKTFGLVGDNMVFLPDYVTPVIPLSTRALLNNPHWEIKNDTYKRITVSRVTQFISGIKCPAKNFIKIDGYYITELGLWLSVPNGIKGAESGLWFFTAGIGRIRRIADYGRVIENPL